MQRRIARRITAPRMRIAGPLLVAGLALSISCGTASRANDVPDAAPAKATAKAETKQQQKKQSPGKASKRTVKRGLPDYRSADFEWMLGRKMRELRRTLQEKLPHESKAIVAIALKVETDGRMSFLHGNYLRFYTHPDITLPDGRVVQSTGGYRKAGIPVPGGGENPPVEFPVAEINAILEGAKARQVPRRDSMISARFTFDEEGDLNPYRGEKRRRRRH